jgi:glutamine---fructose-6-phosphate transaminase (isomerizing)
MCGIVGAVAQRDVAEILVEGLRRLEYRGYDSAGLALLSGPGQLHRLRRLGKVSELSQALEADFMPGGTGMAHTRWATHGEPSERNAHPHLSSDRILVVHNGIIENYSELKKSLQSLGYVFSSDTDTEVIAHAVNESLKTAPSLLAAVQNTVKQLRGAYGMVVMDTQDTEQLVVARSGSPLVIGLGIGETFVASDQLALLPVTRRFIYLEEGDIAQVGRRSLHILNAQGQPVERAIQEATATYDAADKGQYRHYMLKEIHEQPQAVANTLEGRLGDNRVLDEAFGPAATALFSRVQHVQIVACGTSYHAGMVARYWLEAYAGVSCQVEIASEFRYRRSITHPNSLLVTVSQSGETADTLAPRQNTGLYRQLGAVQCGGLLVGARIGFNLYDPCRRRDRRRLHQGVHYSAGRVCDLDARLGTTPWRA